MVIIGWQIRQAVGPPAGGRQAVTNVQHNNKLTSGGGVIEFRWRYVGEASCEVKYLTDQAKEQRQEREGKPLVVRIRQTPTSTGKMKAGESRCSEGQRDNLIVPRYTPHEGAAQQHEGSRSSPGRSKKFRTPRAQAPHAGFLE